PGRRPGRGRQDHQVRVSEARPQVPSRRQQRPGRSLQGDRRGVRSPVRSREAPTLRHARFRLAAPRSAGRAHGPRRISGRTRRGRREADVRIPAGGRTGKKVRVSGEGGGGTGGRGDLYLVVSVAPHTQFERKGDDVQLTLPITAPEAALGATIEVPTLRGKVSMKIPPATSSGRTFRLPGYGMPRL